MNKLKIQKKQKFNNEWNLKNGIKILFLPCGIINKYRWAEDIVELKKCWGAFEPMTDNYEKINSFHKDTICTKTYNY